MTYRPYNALKASGIQLNYINGSGASMPKATPVKIKSDGNMDFINVSIEADVLAIGGCVEAVVPNAQRGGLITNGRIENVTITGTFGDAVWLSKSGGLTTTKPDIGVGGFLAGDFVVRIGTIAKNEIFPIQKDLVLELTLVGQLAV